MNIKNLFLSFANVVFYSMPMIVIFTIVLLAYWPGILVSDSMVQWNEVQTGRFTDWHPAYNTIYIRLLTSIWNNPGFVLFVQCIILSLCMGFVMTRLKKYYNVNKIFLLFSSIFFAIIPLNFNFAVTLLKDTLYSALILLLTGLIIDLINDQTFLNKKIKCLCLLSTLLMIVLFRHNGIIVSLLSSIVLILKFRKQKNIYIIIALWIVLYLLLTKVGFKILKIQEGNYANKYGPISHVMSRMLNTEGVVFKSEELEILSRFVDVKQLKESYNPYNMDSVINSQKTTEIRNNSTEYVQFAFRKFGEYPIIVVKHYVDLTSFLYSPLPFNGASTFGMFTETDLWEYKDKYPQLNENSKLPFLLPVLKNMVNRYQSEKLWVYTLRPAWYMYLSIVFIIIISYINKKSWSLIIILLPSLFNTLSLAPAIPVAMTRYVYATMLVFYFILIWFMFEIFVFVKEKIDERKNK